MNRLTKFEKSPNSMFPYKLIDESLCTELDSIHKLGRIEDLMEKYQIKDIEMLEKIIVRHDEYSSNEEKIRHNFSGKNDECTFNVLFKATKNGFWYQAHKNKFIHLVPDDNHVIVYDWNDGYPILQYMEITKDIVYTIRCVCDVYLTDYKKSFWLREDKSE